MNDNQFPGLPPGEIDLLRQRMVVEAVRAVGLDALGRRDKAIFLAGLKCGLVLRQEAAP